MVAAWPRCTLSGIGIIAVTVMTSGSHLESHRGPLLACAAVTRGVASFGPAVGQLDPANQDRLTNPLTPGLAA